MADIDMDEKGSGMPAGIPTWNLIYNAIDRVIKRVEVLEQKIKDLEHIDVKKVKK